MALVILGLAGLIRLGGRALRRTPSTEPFILNGEWPAATIIVPATGADPGLADNLRSLLIQEYPDYQVIITTRDSKDPAVPIILETIQDHPRATHIRSGRATRCGQKNQNLIAGVREAGDFPDILVFCDSTRLAPANFLQELLSPIAQKKARVTSGYHHIIPGKAGISTLGHAASVLFLFLTKGVPGMNQPWGGATAIRRSLFESLEVEQLWAENIVDDVSLAARLVKAGIPVISTPKALLSTPLASESITGWNRWLIRQWFYLKVCLPGSWLAAGGVCYLLAGLIVFSCIQLMGAILGMVSVAQALPALVFLLALTGQAGVIRRFHPAPGPWYSWIISVFAMFIMAGLSHLQTLFTWRICWRDTCYKVTWKGKVLEIIDK
ncbi:MAG: glycosyltransferase [Desulfobacterales bacterium]|nr:glycosyltransferase [Desulfobacterales bacterium]